jgi:hypothetical protein
MNRGAFLAKKSDRMTVRFQPAFIEEIERAAKEGGFASPGSFVRQACANQLAGASRALGETEERILATLERQSRDLRKLTTAVLVTHSLLDTFVKLYLAHTPELDPEVRPAAVAAARSRYDKLTRDVARNMTGKTKAALEELNNSLVMSDE